VAFQPMMCGQAGGDGVDLLRFADHQEHANLEPPEQAVLFAQVLIDRPDGSCHLGLDGLLEGDWRSLASIFPLELKIIGAPQLPPQPMVATPKHHPEGEDRCHRQPDPLPITAGGYPQPFGMAPEHSPQDQTGEQQPADQHTDPYRASKLHSRFPMSKVETPASTPCPRVQRRHRHH
jgi:hypothetical protein